MSLLERTPATSFELSIPGTPEGKDRPRFRIVSGRGTGKRPFVHVYTTKKTEAAEKRVRDAWEAAGSPFVEAPVTVDVVLYVPRAASHYLTGGGLSAVGRRLPYPTGKTPDVDNALKLILDALNKRAYRDDVDVIVATVRRVWCDVGSGSTRVRVATWGG